jgi:hypothetical protein
MPRLTWLYSGVAWYWANATFHCASVRGGKVPTIGCHSVIDRPECVRRVTPPTTTMANTSAQQTSSQATTARVWPLPAWAMPSRELAFGDVHAADSATSRSRRSLRNGPVRFFLMRINCKPVRRA